MALTKQLYASVAALAVAVCLAGAPMPVMAQQAPQIDANDIGGIVTGAKGPEAGVWVIAETTELPTRFARMVVTDDQGRYVIPDLPNADYRVWVRGYGLVDSPKVRGVPGQHLNLTAVQAPTEAEAAQYYPAIYWYSMMQIPAKDQFGGKGDIPPKLTQADYLKQMKNIGCIGCHQIGSQATRTFPAALKDEKTSEDKWIRLIQSGQYGEGMVNQMGKWNNVPIKYLAEWTDRIAKGELPHAKPPRPTGVERNIVVTWWAWSAPDKYLHDLISSDRRNPTVNGNGILVGSPEYSTDNLPILDPKANKAWTYKAPVRDPSMPESLGPGHAASATLLQPSPYYGDKKLWDTRFNTHNAMFDQDGRLWFSASIRGRDNPAWCKKGSSNPYAKAFPLDKSSRQVAWLDVKTMKMSYVDTCFATHHLQFGYDKDNTLWLSGTGPVAGWVNTKTFLETGDSQKSIGWTAFVRDADGNGKRDDYVQPNQPLAPGKDQRINVGSGPYAVMPSPVDGSIWYTVGVFGGPPGFVRFDPKTQLSEIYDVPMPAFGIRGGDIDSQGVVWGSASSGHLVSFDRRKCKAPLNGPKATGNHCPEGWSFYKYPGPGFAGIGDNSAESSYYTWVDQHNTLGLGNDVPISTGNLNDGMLALVKGQWVVLRVPYPMGHYSKGLDGRIDDANAGWKGRGLWTASGDRTPWLKEGGKGMQPLAIHFQVRPDPLAH
jgi:hypothetical protein